MKKSKMAFILLLIWGGLTIFAGIVGYLEEYHRSEGYFIKWQPAAKSPVQNGGIISATTHSVYVQGESSSVYRLDLFHSASAGWVNLPGDVTVPPVNFHSCWFRYKEHPFPTSFKQGVKTSTCSSGGYIQTDFVLANDGYIWYWTQEISDFEPLYWYYAAFIGAVWGFFLGAVAGLISLFILILGNKTRIKRQIR